MSDRAASYSSCLDELIADQAKVVNEAKAAEDFKKELEELLKKANAAKQAYTRDKYEDFKKRWKKQDAEIVCAIEHVICKVKCWWCSDRMRDLPSSLQDPVDRGAVLTGIRRSRSRQVHSLRDLRYWHERNRTRRAAVQIESRMS